jgi:cell division protein FtsL
MAVAARAQTHPRRIAQPAPRAPARPRPRPRPQVRARPRVAGGVAWIVVVAALLAGIVALNVAVLRLNVEVEELDRRQDRLVASRDALSSELSSAAAASRIESLAIRRLGLTAPVSTTYLELQPRR